MGPGVGCAYIYKEMAQTSGNLNYFKQNKKATMY